MLTTTDEIDVRSPPYEAVRRQHLPRRRGKCQWCGKPTKECTETGLLKFWHADCEWEFLIIVRPDSARSAVFKRDRGICADCGEDWSERYWLKKGVSVSIGLALGEKVHETYWAEHRDGFYHYTELIWVSRWHVDHKIPLWKVAHLPPLKRIEYFKLKNLLTRCDECHAKKSAKEAAERAHFKRLGKKPTLDKPKKRWGSRKIASRGFDKRKRPMRRR